jgi:molybdopterin synthase sulfur carrier subunit
MEVTVYGPLRSATGQKQIHVAFDGGTVAQALDAFVTAYPRAERQLCTDADRLAPSVRLLVDDTAVAPEEECPPDATLTIHPAMRGG